MDDDLAGGSTAATGGTPAAQPSADWNTSLAVPAPIIDAMVRPATNSADSPLPPKETRPAWQEPAELPAVQRVLAGPFGQKLKALDDAARTTQAVLASIDVEGLSDPEVIALTQAVERAGRPVDAARVRTAATVGDRSRPGLGNDSLAWKLGAPHQNDLLTRLTGTSIAEMKRRMELGDKVAPRVIAGRVLEPVFPHVAAALTAGELGVDAAATIVAGLADYKVHGRFDADQDRVDDAEAGLVERATGSVFGRIQATDEPAAGAGRVGRLGDSDGFSYTADEIRKLAARSRALLNPDGAAPNEPTLEAKSTITFGDKRDGLYPIRGGVPPDLKGIMQALFNTYQSARSAPKFPSAEEQQRIEAGELVPGEILDERTGGQKRADILRGILTQVAQDPRTPTMGGMPPTVMVHVNAADLLAGTGLGWIDGVDAPISMKTVNQMIDNGGMQPVYLAKNGAVLDLGTRIRFFNRAQRRAITARDGGCIIPGCSSPPQWAEVHHVVPWFKGGPTDVSNGVLLCWYHHHTIETSGWEIRMVKGVPQVKAPRWIDPSGRWRKPDPHRAHDSRS
ncbi:DUF222 domain-containing protein [Cryobacterium sp. AP23]